MIEKELIKKLTDFFITMIEAIELDRRIIEFARSNKFEEAAKLRDAKAELLRNQPPLVEIKELRKKLDK